MAINVAEITSVLKREIAGFEQQLKITDVGTVIEVGDGIARIYGLKNAMAGEEDQNLIAFAETLPGVVEEFAVDHVPVWIRHYFCFEAVVIPQLVGYGFGVGNRIVERLPAGSIIVRCEQQRVIFVLPQSVGLG